jgi:hypothetical protein
MSVEMAGQKGIGVEEEEDVASGVFSADVHLPCPPFGSAEDVEGHSVVLEFSGTLTRPCHGGVTAASIHYNNFSCIGYCAPLRSCTQYPRDMVLFIQGRNDYRNQRRRRSVSVCVHM